MGRKLFLVFVIALLVAAGVGGAYWMATIQIKNTFSEAKTTLQEGDLQKATSLFERVYRKRPSSREGFESLATLCQLTSSLEQKEKALEFSKAFLQRAQSEEDRARAKYYWGCALLAQGNPQEGITAFCEVLSKYPSSSVADETMFILAKTKVKEGKFLDAKELLRTIIERYPDSNLQSDVYKEYGAVNIKILFSPTPTEHNTQYRVVGGDTVEGIAKKFGTTASLIREANGLSNAAIRKGQILKIDTNKYALVISKSRNTLTLLANGELFKIYPVGTGRANSTPAGDYKITNKLVNPPWFKSGGGMIPFGDEANLLGTRWMGINLPGYGIHGTWEPETIGKQSSAGCVRLLNEDVEELFKIVNVGTPVKIVD